MAGPDKLRIPQGEGRFEDIGRFPDGTQFYGCVTGAFPGGVKYPPPTDEWMRKKRWLAVVHLFDAEGNHLRTDCRLGGMDGEGREAAGENAYQKLQLLLGELVETKGDPEFQDIWVRPFRVEVEGVVFGLMYEPDEDCPEDPNAGCVMLEPQDVMFHPPWDSGEYST
jgi:formate hydrogenlyase regulatory protein HycA